MKINKNEFISLVEKIVKTKQGYQVKSEKGKNLSAKNLTKKQAQKRLQDVEYFKHKG